MTTINITQALCLTLVHSLWQGFLAAVAAGIIILCTRKSKAAVRYNLLTADLVLFMLVTVFTFSHELRGGNGPGGAVSTWVAGKASSLEEAAVLSGIELQVHAGVERSTGFLGQADAFLSLHASTVVLVWLLCLLGQLVQLMGGFYQIGRLRRRRVLDPGVLWQERLQALAVRCGIRKTVALIQSAYVSVPVTFGFLKPSILVPLGMLANLPADQVEAILLHELAHIRRNDYLANLLLHITEALFFFNPGLRWVASLIREEREACCDDMVLNTADRNSYFDALVAFGENAFARQRYALPLSKGKTDLLWRIRRMLNQENKKLHIMEKALLSFGLMAILAIGLISMRAAEQQADKRQADKRHTARLFAWQGTDTLPTSPNTLGKRAKTQFPSISTRVEDNGSTKQYKIDATDVEGNTFQLTKVNGTVTELVINGRSIPAQDFDQYLYIFDEIENRNHETAGEQEGEDKVALAERELNKAQERLDAANQEQIDVKERLDEQQERQQELLEQQQEQQQEKMEQDQERKQEAAEQEAERQQEAAEKQQEAAEKKQEADEQEVERNQEKAEQQAERQQEAYEKQQEAYEKQQEAYAEQEESRNAADRAIHQIVSDMIELGLAESSAAVHSFKLDSNGLTLNGARQSVEAFEVLRRKYIRNAAEHYSYSHNGNGTTTDVKQERK